MCPEDWASLRLIFYWRDLWSLSGNHVPGSCCWTGTSASRPPCRVSWVHVRGTGRREDQQQTCSRVGWQKSQPVLFFILRNGPAENEMKSLKHWKQTRHRVVGGARRTAWLHLNDYDNKSPFLFLFSFLTLNSSFTRKKKIIKLLLGNKSLKPFWIGLLNPPTHDHSTEVVLGNFKAVNAFLNEGTAKAR